MNRLAKANGPKEAKLAQGERLRAVSVHVVLEVCIVNI